MAMLKGLITEAELKQLKEFYGGNTVLCKKPLDKGADDVVFRILTQQDIQALREIVKQSTEEQKPLSVEDVNLFIFKSCVVWPALADEDIDNLRVGIVPSIVKSIQEKSGYSDITILGQAIGPDLQSVMVREFPYWKDITPEELEKIKKKYPNFEFQKIRVGKFFFIIRPMTRTDIRIANQADDRALTMARAVAIWPENIPWDAIGAGYIESIGEAANAIAGWDHEAEVEEI
jgi:hypothetical protein